MSQPITKPPLPTADDLISFLTRLDTKDWETMLTAVEQEFGMHLSVTNLKTAFPVVLMIRRFWMHRNFSPDSVRSFYETIRTQDLSSNETSG